MESSVKSACFDEISHTILDADEKLTVKTISNNWDITLIDAAVILEEWFTKNTKHILTKEYLVKGTDKNGNGVITIVPDTKLDLIQKKLKHFSKILHSIELASQSSSKTLVVPEYDEIKMINLHIDSKERDFVVAQGVRDEPVATTSKTKLQPPVEKKKEVSISTMFSSSGKSDKKSIKTDSEENEIDSSPDVVIKSKISPKKEPQTPKKAEATTTNPKESPKHKKDAKKPIPKNSIASFFIQAGNKPKPATATVSASQSSKPDSPKQAKHQVKTLHSGKTQEPPEEIESIPEKESPERVSSKPVKSKMVTPKKKESKTDSVKRSILAICDSEDSEDDIIPTTPQAKKQPKLKRTKSKQNGNAKKRTRIIHNESSDEDDGEVKKNGKSSDIENVEVVLKSPERKLSKTQNGDNSSRKRHKAKRTVTRTYEDSDGFFKTVKEVEEYSCSDDDVQVEPIKSPAKQNRKSDKTDTKKSPTKQTPSKKNEKPATKQGSITSFFTKK